MKMKVPNVRLNSGFDMPVFGLGTWKSKPGEVVAAVKDAIDAGYRHIDGAAAYQNEAEVGEAIHTKIKENVVKREDLFITSKLWNTFHRPDLVPIALQKSLKDLGLDYLDLYLIHWPMAYQEGGDMFPKDANGKFVYSQVDYLDTWKALEDCVKQGLVRSIGVSNFNSQQINRLLTNCTVKPVINQVECHPYLNQAKLLEFCKSKGIVMTAYSPLGSPDRPWAKPTDPKLLDDPRLISLAKKHGKSPAQVVLRMGLIEEQFINQIQRGLVVIPKSVHMNRLIENISIFDFELGTDDINYINGLNCGGRACALEWVKDHPLYPFNTEY